MLYNKNKQGKLEDSLFMNPTSEYRGAPFWAWNCKLDKDMLSKQIEYLKQMGLGGFHIHSRTGMDTAYLSGEFMENVNHCVKKAENENMLVWLYDEDRFPSGFAGGLVTKEPKYRAKSLVYTPFDISDDVSEEIAIREGKTYFLACYDIHLNENGELLSYKKIDRDADPSGDKWYAFVKTNKTEPWFNNQAYLDTLDKEAVSEFIKVTYEAYKDAVGDKFGTVIPAIFTDEPQFNRIKTLDFAEDKTDVFLPWSQNLLEDFNQIYHIDLLDKLPELIWGLPNKGISKIKYYFHDYLAERFSNTYAGLCGEWCEKNGIMLTGHLMDEPTLKGQSEVIGEAMRSYRFFQLPGIDMLRNEIELTSVKQAQSVAHQYGREGVMSELYGVTNWDFDFRGHKFQGDWQAALGVTVRVQHLAWVSMAGEAKRDYPTNINYQSPWFKEYSYVEDHFARINTALTRGKPIVKIGVIHPIESYWIHFGPNKNTSEVREMLDKNFYNVTKWLLFGQMDFDFISEALLPSLCKRVSDTIEVGEMEYSTIIVPGCETLRKTTLDILSSFKNKGGTVIFIGACPKYIDAEPSKEIFYLYSNSKKVDFNKNSILNMLEHERLIDIRNSDGTRTSNLIYSMRQDNDCKWLFIAHGIDLVHVDVVKAENIIIKIKGEYTPLLYNTLNGEILKINYEIKGGNTYIEKTIYCHDSLLLKLEKMTEKAYIVEKEAVNKSYSVDFKNKVTFMRSEPNVLLLDTARYAFDGGEWNDEEELLRADNIFRNKLRWPLRGEASAQAWTVKEETINHYMTLEFIINSEINVNTYLAIEDAQNLVISLNNVLVSSQITGYYVDESIKTVALPPLKCGKNILTVKIPFGRKTNVEYCYILGNFNVRVEGCIKTIIAPTTEIGFSTITDQGMPFYGGNITYRTSIKTNRCKMKIKINNYRGTLIKVYIDSKFSGIIAYAPYELMIENIPAGEHIIDFVLFGNRYNTFAALHNVDTANKECGPNFWRTTGDAWGYEYKLKDTGILKSPVIEVFE